MQFQFDPFTYLIGLIPREFMYLLIVTVFAVLFIKSIYADNRQLFNKKVLFSLMAIILIIAAVFVYFIANGYTKEFKVTVRDKNDTILIPSSVSTDIPPACYQIISSSRPAIIKLCNKDMSVHLRGQHRALEATKEFKLVDFARDDSSIAIKMNNVSTKVHYRRNEKSFKISSSLYVKPDISGVNLYTSSAAHEIYVTLTPKLLENTQSYEIRNKFFVYTDKTQYFINIGDALKVTVGEPGMNSVEVSINPSRENKNWSQPMHKTLESQLYFNKQLTVSTAIVKSNNSNKLLVTVYNDKQDNKTMEFELGNISLMPIIKVGAISSSNTKERVMRLIETEIITNADPPQSANTN